MEVLFLSIVVSIVLVLVTSIGMLMNHLICQHIILLLLLLVSLTLYYGRSSKGNTVCLLGLSNAGKTLLYARVNDIDFIIIVTSTCCIHVMY